MESLYRKNPAKYVHLWRSSPQGNIFLIKKQRSVLHYYKNPKPSKNKVRIIYLRSGILELWKISNLTFRRFLASTTLVLFVEFFFFFLFVMQILSRACKDRVAYWRFSASSIPKKVNIIDSNFFFYWTQCFFFLGLLFLISRGNIFGTTNATLILFFFFFFFLFIFFYFIFFIFYFLIFVKIG